jgi:hypothetical protein
MPSPPLAGSPPLPPIGARPFVDNNGYLDLAALQFLQQLWAAIAGKGGVLDSGDNAVPDEGTLAATVDAVASLETFYPAAAAIADLTQRVHDLEQIVAAAAAPLLGTIAAQDAELVTLGQILVRESFLSMGVAILLGGTVVVANTLVAANSRIFALPQDSNTAGFLSISARTPGASFTITSSVLTDSGAIAWLLLTPGSPD